MENAEESILAGIRKLQKVSDDLVVVTNEVFSDSMTDNPEMEEYLKLLGKLNLRMGEMADLVIEVVYGIPVERKDIKNENDNRRCYQGKLAYAKKQNPYIHWTDGELCEGDNIFEAEGVFHFEKYIQSMIKKKTGRKKKQLISHRN